MDLNGIFLYFAKVRGTTTSGSGLWGRWGVSTGYVVAALT